MGLLISIEEWLGDVGEITHMLELVSESQKAWDIQVEMFYKQKEMWDKLILEM